MRAIAASICGLLVALLAAQPGEGASKRKRSRGDGGPIVIGTDPPGRLRLVPDASVAAEADAGPNATERQLTELRLRVELLERQLALEQQQTQQLQQIAAEIRALRAQVSETETRRQEDEQQQAARRQDVQSAVDALTQAQTALASGNDNITAALDQAQATFTGMAARDVQAARYALQNRDLSQARYYLSAAISDALAGR